MRSWRWWSAPLVVLGVLWVAATQWPDPAPPPLFEQRLPPGALDGIAIAPAALSFARIADGERHRLLLVEAWRGGEVTGIDLTAAFPEAPRDPIALLTPFEARALHPAIGTNYPAHGSEVGIEQPFLFPKAVRPTPPRAGVAVRDRLLDHEVELGLVVLAPFAAGQPPPLGFVLVGDYTDRAALLRGIDIGDTAAGQGFGTAKSFPGAMPVGPLLVVPDDPAGFVAGLRLELFVNGQQRQSAEPRRMLWNIERILAEIFAADARRWAVHGAPLGLGLEQGRLLPGSVVLTGTADGVIFRRPSVRQIMLGIIEMAVLLRWQWPGGMFEVAIREWRADRRYLQPGDVVVKRADFLGVISNPVIP